MTIPVRVLVVAAALMAASPASASILVQIDKSAQRMTVSQDGQTLYTWPVSTGKRGYSTPSGSYKAFRMEKDHFSREWDDAPMPHSIFFTQKGHAIHGTDDVKRIGTPASHGCVRLSRAHAATLFAMVKADGVLNTQVVLTGVEPAPSPNVARAPAGAAPQYRNPQYQNPNVARAPNDGLDDQAYGNGQVYGGQTYNNDDRYPAPAYRHQQRAPTDDQRYAYENAPPPSHYRQQQQYGRQYYQQPQPYYGSRYRDPYYDNLPPPPPPNYYRRGYGWN